MITDFVGNGIYLVFTSSPGAGGPACRVLGPYRLVRFAAKGLWAVSGDAITEPIRVATQDNGLCWELDGLDDLPWGAVQIVSPDRPTTARELEQRMGWIKPE